jgi:formylglycine-generating enzyme required for sulfatase activity/serine/threonine protein kinase
MTSDPYRPAHDPLRILGTVVADKYEILSLAGEGGFSLVYKARHLIWQQPVAIKFFVVLEDAPPATRERLLDDFIREGRLMSELSSRSSAIVQARDIGKLQRDEGWIPYMVLEWLDGSALDSMLLSEWKAGATPRTLEEAVTLLEPVAAALDLAHRSHVAHRDLKPANIMVVGTAGGGSSCKLLDFGIAKVMGEQLEQKQQLQATGQQVTAFTPNYGAPEQFSRQYGATGPWTDVFAMALILVELLRGGQRALEGATVFELGMASSNPVRPTPRAFGIAVSDDIEGVFAKALAIPPGERYETMGEFWLDLSSRVFPGEAAWARRGAVAPQRGQHAPSMRSLQPLSVQAVPRSLQPEGAPPASATNPLGATTAFPMLAANPRVQGAEGRTVPVAAVAGVGLVALAAGAFLATRHGADGAAPTSSASPTAALASAAPSAFVETQDDGPCPKGMKPVNGGTFTMGSDDAAFPLWKPAHKVSIDTFCLDVHEVTVAEYRACVTKGTCKPADERPNYPKGETESDAEHEKFQSAAAEFCNWGVPSRENHPINCIDWYRADAYCTSMGWKLPTEAQWEFAARGSDARKFPWGDDAGDHTYMNAAGTEWRDWLKAKGLPAPDGLMYEKSDGFVGTAPAGRFPRAQTQSGQVDMVGNVWEWTRDWYALYGSEPQTNPKGPGAGARKAIRGGGFNGEFSLWLNPAARYHQLATASAHVIGFRCAADVRPAR